MILHLNSTTILSSLARIVDRSRSGRHPSRNGGTRKLADTFSLRRFIVERVVRRNVLVKKRRERPIVKAYNENQKARPNKATGADGVKIAVLRKGRAGLLRI